MTPRRRWGWVDFLRRHPSILLTLLLLVLVIMVMLAVVVPG